MGRSTEWPIFELLSLAAASNDFRAVSELTVFTPDHPGLFAQIAGAIAVSGGSIVDAKIFTTSDGFALDVFSVQDAEGGPFGDADAVSFGDFHVAHTVCYALAGDTDGTDEKMAELLEPWREARQRGRVVRLVERSGITRPARGPRYAPLDHRHH